MTPRHRLVLALACAAQFMVVLDVSVVNVALPAIQARLDVAPADLPWIVNAYALPFAGLLLLGGRLADLCGLRRTLVLGLALFTLASLACGLAGSPAALIAARACQGAGAAVLAPATLTVLTTTFEEDIRPRALAAWTAVGLAGGTAGNLAGGLLTDALSWRWIFLVNVPVGALALLPARLLPGRTGGRRRLDVPGAALATGGVTALTFGITRGWNAHALVIGAAALAAFAVVQSRSPAPLIPLRLLRVRAVAAGNATMLLAGACLNPMWFFLALSMQNVLHLTAFQTGLGFLPHTLLTIAVALHVTPRLMRHASDRALITAGALIAAAGFLWQSRLSPGGAYLPDVLGPAVLISAGGGLLNTPLTNTVTSGAPSRDAGAVSGLMNTTKQAGAALGLAALAALTAREETYDRAFLTMAALLVAAAATARALPGQDRGSPATARRPGQHDDHGAGSKPA
ncbi:MFS transporter [Actinomadura madurae]|uniref:MFS transporter n=1 Tax=Actinomadura madurae TaxID=1993 RepID=UPI0020D1F7B6|nr:MFS transporter [Actinomadura madurae]MCP9954493.1 MFS transporter [Actinomadura madurae]MCP9983722.1 MFS transporter [Actinomadura madurae]MCQ0004709.1 MFS transporter [Actinomadura madurae]